MEITWRETGRSQDFARPLAGKLASKAFGSARMFGDMSASQARRVGLIGTGAAAGAAGSLYNCR